MMRIFIIQVHDPVIHLEVFVFTTTESIYRYSNNKCEGYKNYNRFLRLINIYKLVYENNYLVYVALFCYFDEGLRITTSP